ncbi:flagellar basal body-associated FliL family protein [Marinobacter sp. AN1]|uniref:flagellar basal body-associated FliL family protein n=1 Tax=Marinobacter sp. AN1 TaxID=2886046 RepID=UPI00223104A6|nr:flagellar basal body-associated FliL family protein [Marinobacter sp. AN1]UZD64524.1 flagellar basal body-associated FliL family protein [Marinobacter sp. AN1]
MAENNEVAAPPKKGKLKTILLLVIVLLLAVGLSVAGTLWFLSDSSGEMVDDAAAEVEETFVPSGYMVMDRPLVTTVRHPGRQRYIQVYLAFESTQEPALAAASKHLPLLRNALISELGQSEFMELQTLEGREALPDRLLAVVNESLAAEGEPILDRVLLRNFVVQ